MEGKPVRVWLGFVSVYDSREVKGQHLLTAKKISVHPAIETIQILIIFQLGLFSTSWHFQRAPDRFLTCRRRFLKVVNCSKSPRQGLFLKTPIHFRRSMPISCDKGLPNNIQRLWNFILLSFSFFWYLSVCLKEKNTKSAKHLLNNQDFRVDWQFSTAESGWVRHFLSYDSQTNLKKHTIR